MSVLMTNVICRFCGEQRLRAKEHAWPQWLLKTTDLTDALTRETHAGIAGGVVDQRVQSFQSMRDGHVCATCNNTWMSEIENATKPIIDRVIASKQFHALTGDEVSSLAVWAFKTAIVRNAATNYRKIVPADHYAHLYNNRTVAPEVYVDAAICPTHKGLSGLQSQTFLGFMKPGYTMSAGRYNIVLAIESLLLRIIYFPLSGYDIIPTPDAATRTFRLHPCTPRQNSSLDFYVDYREFEFGAYFAATSQDEQQQ